MGMCTRVKSASLCNFHPKNFSPPPAKFRRGFEGEEEEEETRGSRKEGIDLHPVNEAVDDPMAIKTRGKTDSTSGYVFSDGPILKAPAFMAEVKRVTTVRERTAYWENRWESELFRTKER